jgi:hypothetical protein
MEGNFLKITIGFPFPDVNSGPQPTVEGKTTGQTGAESLTLAAGPGLPVGAPPGASPESLRLELESDSVFRHWQFRSLAQHDARGSHRDGHWPWPHESDGNWHRDRDRHE